MTLRSRKPDPTQHRAEPEKQAEQGANAESKVVSGTNKVIENQESRWRQSYGNKRLDDFIFKYRLLMAAGWSFTVLYSTYRLYFAYYQFQDQIDHDNVYACPSWLSRLLNRSRDCSDYEWLIFLEACTTCRIWKYYLGYILASRLCLTIYPKGLPWISLLFSAMLIVNALIGVKAWAVLLAIPLVLWIASRSRNRLVIAITSVLFLLIINKDIWNVEQFIDSELHYYGITFFHFLAGWGVLRGISFSFHTLQEDSARSFGGLLELINYTFYFPLALYGPFITYKTYRTGIQQRICTSTQLKVTVEEGKTFFLQLLRVLFWALFLETLLHYLYFKKIGLNKEVLEQLDWWSLSAIIYWLGQLLQMKYVVIFGVPTATAAFEGMSVPPLPKCTGCIHRYSTLWRNFDRGLYYFLVQCIYVPVLEFMSELGFTKNWNLSLKQSVASLFPYAFVCIWHGNHVGIFVWVAINFLTVTIERIGSGIKRMVDRKYSVHPVIWDMIVEPLVTIPLTITSFINSAIITDGFVTGQVIAQRFLAEWPHGIPVIFFATNVGVAARYWNREKTKRRTPVEKAERL